MHRCIHAVSHLIEDHAKEAQIPIRFAASKIIEGDHLILEQLKLDQNERELLEHSVVEMEQAVDVEAWQKYFVSRGVWIRPFGRTVYIMPPFVVSDEELHLLSGAVCDAVTSAAVHGSSPALDNNGRPYSC